MSVQNPVSSRCRISKPEDFRMASQASSVVKLLTALEDQDDTQEVVSNFDVDEKELSRLMQEQNA